MAKMIGFSAILLTMSWDMAPLTESPKNTLAPATASSRVLSSVSTAWADFPGGARPVDHHLGFGEIAAGQMQGVDQPRRGDDRGAVLVVVEHRDIEQLLQLLLDHEALGRLDVLQVDAPEGRAQEAHAVDELVHVPGVDLQVEAVHVGETLEQHRLAFHDRLGRQSAQIAQPQDRGAIGNDRHQVALGGVVIGLAGVLLDLQAGHRDAGRIGQRQVALGGQGLGGADLELAGAATGMEFQGVLLGELNRIRHA
jgi:hypothetical protein